MEKFGPLLGWLLAIILVILLFTTTGMVKTVVTVITALYAVLGMGYHTMRIIKPFRKDPALAQNSSPSRLSMALRS